MTSTNEHVPSYPFSTQPGLGIDPRMAQLRAEQPVLRIRTRDGEAWLVTRHAEIKAVLTNPTMTRDTGDRQNVPRGVLIRPPLDSILLTDAPRHTRLRRLVAKAFTVRGIEGLRPRTQQIVDDLLNTIIASGPPADLADGLTWPAAAHHDHL